MCHNVAHYHTENGAWSHSQPADCRECNKVEFRAIPDTVPDILETTYSHPEDGEMPTKQVPDIGVDYGKFNHEQMKKTPYPDGLRNEGDQANKSDYAAAYDRELKVHLWDHMGRRGPWRPADMDKLFQDLIPQSTSPTDQKSDAEPPGEPKAAKAKSASNDATFVHLFGAPLFKVVSANWARLIVRRSFDLDLLEWRPPSGMTSATVEEIKSRRVAIGSHYRDIEASVEILSGLTQEERPITLLQKYGWLSDKTDPVGMLKLALFETGSSWNRARSNGFVAGLADKDSWEKIYYDFFELRASVKALARRADKIQDGIIGLIQVWGGEQSQALNWIAIGFSLLVIPFTIIGTLYNAGLRKESSIVDTAPLLPNHLRGLIGVTFSVAGALIGILLLAKWPIIPVLSWFASLRPGLEKWLRRQRTRVSLQRANVKGGFKARTGFGPKMQQATAGPRPAPSSTNGHQDRSARRVNGTSGLTV